MIVHPARAMPFDELIAGLYAAKAAGSVNRQYDAGLSLWCYSRSCVYDRAWDRFSLIARGLILDEQAKKVVATPFPKFFNVGENDQTIPDLPFETFEKLDGSLIIIFWHEGQWRTATKGSLKSEQAQWAHHELDKAGGAALIQGTTYLCEAIYAQNRIVAHYEYEGLVLLAAYDELGTEHTYSWLIDAARNIGWRVAERHSYSSVAELVIKAKDLPRNEEGFVLRFSNGLRLKIKGDEYRRIHALISRCTPLAMWEAMKEGTDLEQVRKDLPEEFWTDFDQIIDVLKSQIASVTSQVSHLCESIKDWPDKEVGLKLDSFDKDIRHFIFPYRKNGGNLMSFRSGELIFRHIRPTGNMLPGYTPSYSINRVMEEAI